MFPLRYVPPPPGLDYNPRRAAGRAEPPARRRCRRAQPGLGPGPKGAEQSALVSGVGTRTDRGDTRGEPSDRLGQESVHPRRTRADRHRLQALLLRAGGAAGARAGPRVCRVTFGEAPALGVSGCQSMAALPGGKGHPSASSPRPWEKHRPPAASSAGWELQPTRTHRHVPPRSYPRGTGRPFFPFPRNPYRGFIAQAQSLNSPAARSELGRKSVCRCPLGIKTIFH